LSRARRDFFFGARATMARCFKRGRPVRASVAPDALHASPFAVVLLRGVALCGASLTRPRGASTLAAFVPPFNGHKEAAMATRSTDLPVVRKGPATTLA
jgi:hypothetical protein